jgi:hypothetical protein
MLLCHAGPPSSKALGTHAGGKRLWADGLLVGVLHYPVLLSEPKQNRYAAIGNGPHSAGSDSTRADSDPAECGPVGKLR